MDGIDGIAGIQAVVAGGSWFFIARLFGMEPAAWLALCLVGGTLEFLTLNWPPAKIFMGDAGSTVLGLFFGLWRWTVRCEARP